jgi:hypothetical protein
MFQEFKIILPSNVKSISDENPNKICKYSTKLFKRIDLPNNELWKVGISEISYSKSWYNIRNYSMISFYDYKGNDYYDQAGTNEVFSKSVSSFAKLNYELSLLEPQEQLVYHHLISPGYYKNIEDLITYLNEKLKNLQNIFYVLKAPKLEFNKHSHRITIHVGILKGTEVFPYFGEEIEYILGLTDHEGNSFRNITKTHFTTANSLTSHLDTQEDQMITNAFQDVKCFIGPRCVEFSPSNNSIYVYSNIVEHNLIGDTYAQILRVVKVPKEAKFGEQVTIHFINPDYIPLQTRSFDTISLELNDDTGREIQFQFGRVIIELTFKKYGEIK